MILKNRHLILILGLLSVQLTHSQFTSIGEQYNRFDTQIKTFDYFIEPTDGSPYIYKEYSPAKLTMIKEICSVNYDAYLDKMEVENKGKIYYLPQNNFDYTIEFINTKKTYQLFNYLKTGEITPGFFLILTKKSDTYLLKKKRINKYDAKKATNGYDQARPITFKRMKDSYYASYGNNTATKIPHKKKHFLALFNQKNKVIATYMKQQKLSHRKEEDLIKIFNYYTSIM